MRQFQKLFFLVGIGLALDARAENRTLFPLNNRTSDTVPLVKTSSGYAAGEAVRPYTGSAIVHRYLGVPFAKPPTAQTGLRFKPPVDFVPTDPNSVVNPSIDDGTGIKRQAWKAGCAQPADLNAGPTLEQLQRDPNLQPKAPLLKAGTSEDCLYLNIFAPKSGSTKRPVIVWIHGGAYISGDAYNRIDISYLGLTQNTIPLGAPKVYSDGSQVQYAMNIPTNFQLDLTEGTDLATASGAIVISIQYRLGALGFLASPELRLDSPNAFTNFGMLDQIQALKWVKKNIGNFGGDAQNITIMGESAGGQSVCNLLASPKAAGLFQKAILQSGQCTSYTLRDAESYHAEILNLLKHAMGKDRLAKIPRLDGGTGTLDCSGVLSAACLRNLPVDELVGRTQALKTKVAGVPRWFSLETFVPVVDGILLDDLSSQMLAAGKFNKVPVLLGSNLNEMGLSNQVDGDGNSLPKDGWMMTSGGEELSDYSQQFSQELVQSFGSIGGQTYYQIYGPNSFSNAKDSSAELTNQLRFHCAQRSQARDFSKYNPSSAGVYLYSFNKKMLGVVPAFHGSEIAYVFQKIGMAYGQLSGVGFTATRTGPDGRSSTRSMSALDQTLQQILEMVRKEDLNVSEQTGKRWSQFAAGGSPNLPLTSGWPAFTAGSDAYLNLDSKITPGTWFRKTECDAYDSYAAPLGPYNR